MISHIKIINFYAVVNLQSLAFPQGFSGFRSNGLNRSRIWTCNQTTAHGVAVPVALLVGSNGLEPSTSRLSGVCSNQLSYEPV